MHGRVKVRTSEEEKLRKEKERQQKVVIFQKAMKKIQSKRNEGQLDKELLDITGQVLSSNPDIYTLWNIRRDTVKVLSKTEEDNDVITRLYDDELSLTEYCLKVNPKSYCAWHHREWVLTMRSDPDWKKELGLCDNYLRLDERNFHTWDYRRFVVAQYKPPLKEEFDFTTEKIHENFSNYSAWHYRSKMLVELYPDLEAGRPIEDSHHKHELELVMNAAFTDPDDTSAWFYQCWLLGAVKETTQVVVYTVAPNKATVAFNKHVTKDFVMSKINLTIGDSKVEVQWIPCTGNMYDNLWICAIQENIVEDLDIKLEFETETGEKTVISSTKQDATTYVGKSNVNFQKQYSIPVIEELKKQLISCRQLLDFEPDNKWTLLTTTVFLHCIDPMVYHEETISNLQTLKQLDKLRAGYYNDLITKWSIEEQIRRDHKKSSNELRIAFKEKITSLPHLQFYSHCDNVDLSNQSLASNCLASLVVLQHCKILNLENNDLKMLKNFPKLDLKELNLKGNNLNAEEVKQFAENVNYNVLY